MEEDNVVFIYTFSHFFKAIEDRDIYKDDQVKPINLSKSLRALNVAYLIKHKGELLSGTYYSTKDF